MARPGKPLGYRHYRWTVIGPMQSHERERKNSRRVMYPVRCDCGTERIIILCSRSKSCGCLSRETYLSYEDRHINDIYSITKSSCKTGKSYRRVAFELTREEFKEIIGKNCHYCGVGPSNYRKTPGRDYVFKYNGVDRIDCSIGYLSTNVVPCCKRCNAAKNNQTVAEFREWLERAARFQQLI